MAGPAGAVAGPGVPALAARPDHSGETPLAPITQEKLS